MFARLPKFGVPQMGTSLSRSNQPGLCEPLHPHVRDPHDGGIRTKPQEGGSEQEQAAASVLHEQGKNLHRDWNDRADTSQTVLFVFCACNELFFIALYLLSFSSPMLSPSLLPSAKEPGQSVQPGSPSRPGLGILIAPGSASAMELARANKMDSFWPWVLAGVSFPIMAAKQILNVIQLVKASRWLAEGDTEARRAQGLPRRRKAK